jgi:hypothetical protein
MQGGTQQALADSFLNRFSARPIVIEFSLPENLLAPTTLIMEAPLKVCITPLCDWDSTIAIGAYCMPITEPIGPNSDLPIIPSPLNNRLSEFSHYFQDEGILFFEISKMLYAATEGEISFYGVVIIPEKNSPRFTLTLTPQPIEFGAAYYLSKKGAAR